MLPLLVSTQNILSITQNSLATTAQRPGNHPEYLSNESFVLDVLVF